MRIKLSDNYGCVPNDTNIVYAEHFINKTCKMGINPAYSQQVFPLELVKISISRRSLHRLIVKLNVSSFIYPGQLFQRYVLNRQL